MRQFADKLWWGMRSRALIAERIYRRGRPHVMGRIACLGQDVYRELNWSLPVLNTQKGRADCMMAYFADSAARPVTAHVAPHFARRDIVPLIAQQEVATLPSASSRPIAILIDSYAELTDQKFEHRRKRWFFCANYTDLAQDDAFKAAYDCKGLLAVDKLDLVYLELFLKLRKSCADTPIIFLHFPIKLDGREKFKVRGAAILESIARVGPQLTDFHSIRVDDSIVNWPEHSTDRSFPYHFNNEVYVDMARQIAQLRIV